MGDVTQSDDGAHPAPRRSRWFESPAVPAAVIIAVVALIAAIPPAAIRAGEPQPGEFAFEPFEGLETELESRMLRLDDVSGQVLWSRDFHVGAYWFGAIPDGLLLNFWDSASHGFANVSIDGNAVWMTRLGEGSPREFRAEPELLENGVVIAAIDERMPDDRTIFIGIDGTTGEALWTRELAFRAAPYEFLNGLLVFVERGSGIRAIDTRTGEDRWFAEVECRWQDQGSNPVAFHPGDDALYVYIGECPFDDLYRATADGAISSLAIDDRPASLVAVGEAALLDYGRGVVRALDPTDGDVLWRRRGRSDNFLVADGVGLLRGARYQEFIGVDLGSGDALWRIPADRDVDASTTVDGLFFLRESKQRSVVVTAIDSSTGEIVWQQEFAGSLLQPPELHDGSLIVGLRAPKNQRARRTGPSFVAALDTATGDVVWRTELEEDLQELVVDDRGVFLMETPFLYPPARSVGS